VGSHEPISVSAERGDSFGRHWDQRLPGSSAAGRPDRSSARVVSVSMLDLYDELERCGGFWP